MRKAFLLGVALFVSFHLFGKEVSPDQARSVAVAFLQQAGQTGLKSVRPTELRLVEGFRDLYLFTINEDEGFILMSAEDATYPVLGYSTSKPIGDPKELPDHVRAWMEGYQQQIRKLRAERAQGSERIRSMWKGSFSSQKSVTSVVEPLIQTRWDQFPFYNDLCPFDPVYQDRTIVGCVATSMAQIMKYWEYPSRGFGVHAYKAGRFGILSADFASARYDWDAMPAEVSGPNEAVATLMYHCGVGAEMDYGVLAVGGSGAQILSATANKASSEYALEVYFGYPVSVQGLKRSAYTDAAWKELLREELDNARPVLYGGFGPGYGHAFVCDGYDANGFFHFNWGWSGHADGYFLLDAMNPGGNTFNDGQLAIIGIHPPNPDQDPMVRITADVTADSEEIVYHDAFTVSAGITNFGVRQGQGEFCALVFDESLRMLDTIQVLRTPARAHRGSTRSEITFRSKGIAAMTPGKYRVYIQYRSNGGRWTFLQSPEGDDTTKVFAAIEVRNPDDIVLSAPLRSLTPVVESGDALQASFNMANNGPDRFEGSVALRLYTPRWELVSVLGEKSGISIAPHQSLPDSMVITCPKVLADSGSYLLALFHKPQGGAYTLTGSAAPFRNPVWLDVSEGPVVSDRYEVNDSLSIAFPLQVAFSENTGSVSTPGSNIHKPNTHDFYALSLPAGYQYAVHAFVHDAHLTTNGKNYSLDAMFRYSIGGAEWSDSFDDVLTSEFLLPGGNTVYFDLSAWDTTAIGSYLLEVKIRRWATPGEDPPPPVTQWSVYPNPFSDVVTLAAPETILEFELFDMRGSLIMSAPVGPGHSSIDLSTCKPGVYILKLKSAGTVYTRKMMKR